MSAAVSPLVLVFKTITLAFGGFITYNAAKAARRSGSEPMALLAVGFGIVTFGSILAGVADQLLAVSGGSALLVENALTSVGFGIIGYSLWATRRGR